MYNIKTTNKEQSLRGAVIYYRANLSKFLFVVFIFSVPCTYSYGVLDCYSEFRDFNSLEIKDMLYQELNSTEVSKIKRALKSIRKFNVKDKKIGNQVIKLLSHFNVDVVKEALEVVKEKENVDERTENEALKLLNHSNSSVVIGALKFIEGRNIQKNKVEDKLVKLLNHLDNSVVNRVRKTMEALNISY